MPIVRIYTNAMNKKYFVPQNRQINSLFYLGAEGINRPNSTAFSLV